ncbi:MAG: O-acetylhomoserine aminocarboxypropyltransferase/cysteine synthase [Proteobacteria bacterium]|jgi:O-acetylhomoserine/O-acetylserine sulfhydrylase-like pyridoxal-dependent enzyme|nr:O-acetylhomoserine aminocarboxypropyltransferase/cysteine synthase [Pseudomonadota bacterium]
MSDFKLRGASVVLHSPLGQKAPRTFGIGGIPLLEERLGHLFDTETALVTSGRTSALALLTTSLLKAGDNLVAADQICSKTYAFLHQGCPRYSIDVRMASRPWELESWEAQIDERTQMILVECPSEPNSFIPDLESLATLAADHCIPLVVDTSVATPALCPAARWADFVLSSLSGPLTGQPMAMGGVIGGSTDRIAPLRTEMSSSRQWDMHPFAASIALLGLQTLYDRLRTARENTIAVRSLLLERRAEGEVHFVNHPSLRKHPQHDLAKKYFAGFAGPLLSFGLGGGPERARRFIDALEMIHFDTEPQATKTTIMHPYSTTHAWLSVEQKKAAVIRPAMLALWVGNEDPTDLIDDLERGFASQKL